MKTFKIQNGDLVFDGQNNLVMVEGKDEEVQSIERILTTNKGEWFLNIEHGLDYSEIQGKGKDIEGIKLAIAEAIYQDDRVEDIEFLEIDIDRQQRKLNVDFKVRTNTGNLLEGIEVMNIG